MYLVIGIGTNLNINKEFETENLAINYFNECAEELIEEMDEFEDCHRLIEDCHRLEIFGYIKYQVLFVEKSPKTLEEKVLLELKKQDIAFEIYENTGRTDYLYYFHKKLKQLVEK